MQKIGNTLKDGANYTALEFRAIKDWEGLYSISNKGHIRSHKAGERILVGVEKGRSREFGLIDEEGKCYKRMQHLLLKETFGYEQYK